MDSPFTPRTLSFLRSLKRHNDREWFRQRKPRYEAEVRAPMIAMLERLRADLRAFAPELVVDPKVSLYRIYRDTRFSADKRPLKTHAAAHFPARGFGRNEGAGLYFEISPDGVWIGGGIYMPSPQDLRAIRAHVAAHHRTLRRLVTARAFRSAVGELDGERLSRVPRGHPADHPAAEYLRFRQFLAGREYDAAFAVSRRFYPAVLTIFRAVAPLVRFLNAPLLAERRALTPASIWTAAAPPRSRARSGPHRPDRAPTW